MKATLSMMALAGALLVAACGDDLLVPDFNNPGLEQLEENPSRQAVINASTGLLFAMRTSVAARNGYVVLLGILGREGYNFDAADPRFVGEMLGGQLRGSGAFGGNLWAQRYLTIRAGTLILNALEGIPDNDMPPEEKEAVRGFTKTIMAHEFLMIINTRDVNGAVLDVEHAPDEEPGAIVPKDQVFAHIVTLLDEAVTHLQAGGSAFPFPLHSGFAGFDTPATFIQFNRALRARVDVYMGNFSDALQSLQGSFINTSAPLDLGVYHVFTTGSGDQTNALFDPGPDDLFAHPSLAADVELKANGEPDDRYARKVRQLDEPVRVQGIETDLAFDIYRSATDRVPIIRNEELILLRAEANIGLGNIQVAAQDINFIRVNSGGLEPLPGLAGASEQEALDELLRQNRYSLLFEGGHRWIDLRRYGRLNDPALLDLPSHVMNTAFPIPEAECLARGLETCSAGS